MEDLVNIVGGAICALIMLALGYVLGASIPDRPPQGKVDLTGQPVTEEP